MGVFSFTGSGFGIFRALGFQGVRRVSGFRVFRALGFQGVGF